MREDQVKDGIMVILTDRHPHGGKSGQVKGGVHKSDIFRDWRLWRIALDDGNEVFAAASEMEVRK